MSTELKRLSWWAPNEKNGQILILEGMTEHIFFSWLHAMELDLKWNLGKNKMKMRRSVSA